MWRFFRENWRKHTFSEKSELWKTQVSTIRNYCRNEQWESEVIQFPLFINHALKSKHSKSFVFVPIHQRAEKMKNFTNHVINSVCPCIFNEWTIFTLRKKWTGRQCFFFVRKKTSWFVIIVVKTKFIAY